MNIDPEGVGLGVDLVDLCGIFELLQDLSRTHSPTFHLDGHKGRWVVVGLEKVVGVNVCGKVGRDQLRILAARL